MTTVMPFDEAIQQADAAGGKTHVLLGNGFSRACRDDIFAYNALFDRADFQALAATARAAFPALDTTDFEVVMKAVDSAAALVQVYSDSDSPMAEQMRRDAAALRELLVLTIASSHPDRPGDIPPTQYASCRRFLAHFGGIYTLNYDLLLYWALMQREVEPQVPFDDGFRQPEDGLADYVTWDVQRTDKQNVHYLHGALHVFDAGPEVQKFTWSNTQTPLVDQIRDALGEGRYPLFVAEGTHTEKLGRIQHSGFLSRAYRSFASIGGSLFIFGHSLADSDEHIVKLIDRGKVRNVFVGLYGDPDTEWNRGIVERADLMAARREEHRPRSPVEVTFYDAQSAHVWDIAEPSADL